MTKAEAIGLLEEWARAIHRAQAEYESRRAKDAHDAAAMAWAYLQGYVALDGAESGILARTKAAVRR
jgi:hypothetical protein